MTSLFPLPFFNNGGRVNSGFTPAVRLVLLVVVVMSAAYAGPACAEGYLTVSAVGDVMLGSEGRMPPADGENLFEQVIPELAGQDLIFCNYEGTLTDRGEPTKPAVSGRSYVFRTPPEYVRHLVRTGFNVVSISNNHAFDYGLDGKMQTIEVLELADISWTDPGETAFMTINGQTIGVAGFHTSPYAPYYINDVESCREILTDLNDQCDILIVSFHGGAEGEQATHVPGRMENYLGEDRGDVQAFARAAVECGADLVVGHGPHVARGMEIYQGRLIAYSLGNFCTVGFSTDGNYGLAPLLQVELDADGALVGGRIVSFVQSSGGVLQPDPQNRAAGLIYRMGQADFPVSNAVAPDGTLITP